MGIRSADGASRDAREGSADGFKLDRRQLLRGIAGAAGVVAINTVGTACGGSSQPSASPSRSSGSPKRGGNFRLGVTGGGAKDIFDGQNFLDVPDQARLVSSFETLLIFNDNYQVTNDGLAEEVTQESPKQWTVHLRKGIEFSNGKTLQAEDVIYSLRRILNKNNGLPGYAQLNVIDGRNLKALDKYTVRIPLLSPNSVLDQGLAQYNNGIVPVGYRAYPAPQHGTGPFILESFQKGQQSISKRNPNYWRTGQPYFDQLTITDFPDVTAQVNALLSGQIDAMTGVPYSEISTVKAHSGYDILVSQTAEWLPLCMAIDLPPFDNNDVRQAMRYIIDRPQALEQVVSGYGNVANDLFSKFDPDYDSALPQRTHDIDKAKFLLKRAGVDHLAVDLHTTNGSPGMVDLASVFANQAKAAGVKVTVRNDPNYYGDSYLKLPFSVDYWGTRDYFAQVSQSMLPTSPFNETHWPPKSGVGSNYAALYSQGLATTNAGLRRELIHQMQTLEYNYGGYVIPFFVDLVDAYSSKVAGFTPSKGTIPLGYFGHSFRTIWFK
jgi:peptide/nickel transport system substrate-binding protein